MLSVIPDFVGHARCYWSFHMSVIPNIIGHSRYCRSIMMLFVIPHVDDHTISYRSFRVS